MSTPDYHKKNEDFVERLVELCKKDQGHRAALRRWWSPGTRDYAYPIFGLLRAMRKNQSVSPEMITAAIYATHSREGHVTHQKGGGSVGKAALRLGNREKDGKHPFDPQFRRILTCTSLEELGGLLNRFVKRLSSNADGYVPLDYVLLMKHLNFWFVTNSPELIAVVKTEWAMDFWQAPAEPEIPAEPATPADA